MPIYNTKREYFQEAIESIMRQTFSDFELIVIDNGSREGYVAEILSTYQDTRIKLSRLDQNIGPARGRNLAISKATGEYIAIMDSDDIAVPDRFEKQLNFFALHREIGCLGGQAEIISNGKSHIQWPKVFANQDIEMCLLFEGCPFCHSTVMLKREILNKNSILYPSQYEPAEDYALWLSLIGKTQFHILQEKLVTYRFYPENASLSNSIKQRQKAVQAQTDFIEKYCKIKGLNKGMLKNFFTSTPLSAREIEGLDLQVQLIIQKINSTNRERIMSFYKKLFKKQYYKIHSLSGQIALWKSKLNQIFKIRLPFRLFYFISRGVL